MKGVVFIVVSSFLVHALRALEPQEVNLELQTILKFDKKSQRSDIRVIDQFLDFLNKIKYAMNNKASGRRQTENEMSFTDFLVEAAMILKEYNDNDLVEAFAIIDDESKRYIYKESDLQELFGDRHVRRYMSDQLDYVKDMPAEMLRRNLDKTINVLKNKTRNRDNNIVEIVNNLYAGASGKLKKSLINLDKIRKSDAANLEGTLKEILRSLVFEHYFNLEPNVKDELINMIKHYWRAFSNKKNSKKTTPKHRFNLIKGTHRLHKGNSLTTKDYFKRKEPPFLIDLNIDPDNNKKKAPYQDLTRTDKKQELSSRGTTTDRKYISTENKGFIEINLDSGSVRDTIGTTGKSMQKKKHQKLKLKKDKPHHPLRYTKGLYSKKENAEISYRGVHDSFEKEQRTTRKKMSKGKLLPEITSTNNPDRKQVARQGKELVITFNKVFDIGVGRRTPNVFNISAASLNGSTTANRSKQNGTSTENFDDSKIKNTVIRKSNANDTFEPDKNKIITESDIKSKNPADVSKIIEYIEKRVEDVEDQVQFVKSLTVGADDRLSRPKFKTINSGEHKNDNETESGDLNSVSLEKDNELFLLNNSPENVTVGNANFKANDGFSAELKAQQDTTSNATSSGSEINEMNVNPAFYKKTEGSNYKTSNSYKSDPSEHTTTTAKPLTH